MVVAVPTILPYPDLPYTDFPTLSKIPTPFKRPVYGHFSFSPYPGFPDTAFPDTAKPDTDFPTVFRVTTYRKPFIYGGF